MIISFCHGFNNNRPGQLGSFAPMREQDTLYTSREMDMGTWTNVAWVALCRLISGHRDQLPWKGYLPGALAGRWVSTHTVLGHRILSLTLSLDFLVN